LLAPAAGLTHDVIGDGIEGGLIINFNALKLTDGGSRLIIPDANHE
jgi:hypothetical protein